MKKESIKPAQDKIELLEKEVVRLGTAMVVMQESLKKLVATKLKLKFSFL